MNKCTLVGRLTKDPEIRYSQGENATATARFSVAVSRRFKNAEGNYDADFINCVAFGKTAEFLEKYFKKGMAIGLTGHIQTGSYTNKDGQKVYTTDVIVEETEFVESKNASGNTTKDTPTYSAPTSSVVVDDDDDSFPFN